MKNLLTEKQVAELHEAEGHIFVVQKALMDADEKLPEEQRNEFWRQLYKMRIDIGQFIHWHGSWPEDV